MRTRHFTALAATAVLVFAACGDDDEEAGEETTIAVVGATTPVETEAAAETTEAAAVTTEAAVATTEAAIATTEAAAATTEAAAVTTEAAAATTEAAAETTEAVAATTEVAAATTEAAAETTEAAAVTTEAAVVTTEAAAVTTEAAAVTTEAAPTTEAAAATTEAGAATTEAAAVTTEAAAETTEAAAVTTEVAGTTEPAAVTTEVTGSTAPGELGEVTIGSADFPESQLIAQIYGQALENAGFDVSYEPGIGAREAYYGAVESGEVDLVPEYTNSLLSFVLDPEQPTAANVEEQVTALGEALPEGLEVLTPSTAEDKDVIVCTQEVADEFGLTDLSSLFENSSEITIGGPPELETRTPFGLEGFSEIYGAEFEAFEPLAIGDVAAALEAGQIDCGNLFSTMSVIQTEGFVALEDDQGVVPNEAVLPLVRSEAVTPEMIAALEEVNAQLDTETLTELLAQVEVEQLGVDVVAEEWLASLGGGTETEGTEAPATTGEPAGTEASDDTEASATSGAPDDTEAPATTG